MKKFFACLRCRSPSTSKTELARARAMSLFNIKYHRRIVVFGAAGVGKTAIIRQFLLNDFPMSYKRTVEDLYVAEFKAISGSSLLLEVYDTTGSHDYPALRNLSILNADAFLLVYSVDDEESFTLIQDLYDQITIDRGDDIPIVIAGNKSDECDIERIIVRDEVESTVKSWRKFHVDCSAIENNNIVPIFEKILSQMKVEFDLRKAIDQREHSNQDQANTYTCTEYKLFKLLKEFRKIKTYGPIEVKHQTIASLKF